MFPHRRKQLSKIPHRWRLAATGAALFLLLLLFPGESRAQSADPQELRLDPIVVTATRTPRRLSTIGDSIESFSKEAIELLIPGDLNDLFRTATGVILEQSGSRGGSTSLRIRGSEDNFVSVLIDGFKISAPDGGRFDFENLSPEWIGGVEILRGPQSPVYGSDAAAGVVNLLLDAGKPGEPFRFETGARHGSFSTWEEFVKVRGGGEKTGFLATLSRVDTNGRFDNDGYHRTVGTIVLDYYPTDRAKIRFLYQGTQSRFDNTSNNGATNTDFRLDDRFTDKELNAFERNETQLVGLRLELRLTPWLEYIPRFSFYEQDSLFEDKADILDSPRSFFSPFSNKTTQSRIHIGNQFNLKLDKKSFKSILTLGFEWEEEKFFSQRDGTARTTDSQRRLARSLYGQEQLTLGRLTLTGGIRVDDFDIGKDEVTAKFSGALRFPRAGFRLRGAIGEGVKRPAFTDLFGSSTFSGNANLKSEKQENWEAGFDQFFLGRKLRFSATYFQTTAKDIIAFSFGGFPNGTNFENISKVRIKGTEFSLALIDYKNFTARVNLNTLDTKVLDDRGGAGGSSFVQGEELLRRPNWWWTGALTYHPDRLRATLLFQQMGDRRDLDFRPFVDGSNGGSARTVNNPGFSKMDLALSFDLLKDRRWAFGGKKTRGRAKNIALHLKLNNLLDEDYDEAFGFNAPGFNWAVGFRVTF